MTSITSITRIPRMLGKFGDDMVFACFMSVQRQCSQDAAATTAAAEESLQGRRSYCRAGKVTAEAEELMHLMKAATCHS